MAPSFAHASNCGEDFERDKRITSLYLGRYLEERKALVMLLPALPVPPAMATLGREDIVNRMLSLTHEDEESEEREQCQLRVLNMLKASQNVPGLDVEHGCWRSRAPHS